MKKTLSFLILLLSAANAAGGGILFPANELVAGAIVSDGSIVFSTTTGSQGLVFQDGKTLTTNAGRILIGSNTAVGNSNAGIQYSDTRQNRGQIRMNQFGNNAGVAGITGFKSRGVDTSSFSPVAVGDPLVRVTAVAVAPNGNVPNVGYFTIQAGTAAHATSVGYVPTEAEIQLVNFQDATLRRVWYLDPNGSVTTLGGLTASSGTFVSSVSAAGFIGSGAGLTNLPGVWVSSATGGGAQTVTNTVPAACIAGSTRTFTTIAGQQVKVSLQGSFESTNNAETNFAFLLDGAYVDSFTDTNHIGSWEGEANSEHVVSWSYQINQTVSAGAHSVCFIIRSTAGTQTIPAQDIVQYTIETR